MEDGKAHIMTVSADWRFKPRPPARVERMNTWYGEFGSLKVDNKACRSSALVEPSRRQNCQPRWLKKSAMRVMISVIWKKISTYWSAPSSSDREGRAYLVTCLEELGENSIKQLEFSWSPHNLLIDRVSGWSEILINLWEDVWVITDFPKLHQSVLKRRRSSGFTTR